MLLHSLKLQNLLSFGPDAPEVPLGPLNVLIGPNGSGKSNFIEAISLLQALPDSIQDSLRRNGEYSELAWKLSPFIRRRKRATIETILSLENVLETILLQHDLILDFSSDGREIRIQEKVNLAKNSIQSNLAFFFSDGHRSFVQEYKNNGLLLQPTEKRILKDYNFNESIFSQLSDINAFPEITKIALFYEKIKIFRSWSFGRQSDLRSPKSTDARNDFLDENCLNLGLVLNRIRREPKAKKQLLDGLKALYAGIDDFDVTVEGGTVQVFLQEGDITISATRLSDGTLRYLCLLAILCHPSPPPLICIEEPELSLHPDLMSTLANLMRDASTRTQIIATTHSDILVDALTETPDSILVCEKHEGSTTLQRLDQEKLSHWLENYSLGELWRSGQIGGNRW